MQVLIVRALKVDEGDILQWCHDGGYMTAFEQKHIAQQMTLFRRDGARPDAFIHCGEDVLNPGHLGCGTHW